MLFRSVSACPVIYGRLNKKGDAPAMMMQMKENVIPVKQYEKLSAEAKVDKITRGILMHDTDKKEYTEAYSELIDSLNKPEEESNE